MTEERRRTSPWSRIRSIGPTKEIAVKGAIALTLVVLLGLMFPRGEAIEFEYKVGGVWAQDDLYAPFSFPILRDQQEYLKEVDDAKKNVYPVFERIDSLMKVQQLELEKFFARLDEALRVRKDVARTAAAADSARFVQLASQLQVRLFEREWSLLAGLTDRQINAMRDELLRLTRSYLESGILDTEKRTLSRPQLALRKGTVEELISPDKFLDLNEVATRLDNDLIAFYGRDNDTVDVAHKIGVIHLVPNIRYQEAATEVAEKAAIASVPRTSGFVQEADRIVSKNERITTDIKQKLDSLRKARVEQGGASSGPFQYVGIILHVAIVVFLFGLYLSLFRPRIFSNDRRLAIVALLILMEGFFAHLTRVIPVSGPVEYLIVVPAASMLLTIIFDSRVGFYGTVTIAYLVAGIRGNDYAIGLAALVAGALSVYTVRDVRNRTQIIRSFGFIFLGYVLTIFALGMERIAPWTVMAEEMTYALANSIISPVLTFGLLIFFERSAKVTTDLTLIELAHFKHPLLKLLSEKAPGTYHHSVSMASLAEAGAAAVGANEVLARVGALFHDIGKIEKPNYFVENQKGTRNRHDKLSPRMSSLIIQNHVKQGMAIARDYNLPEEVIDFIPQHHGTTRIDYFYRKALKLAESSDDETKIDEINEEDYRYPGPRPQTKETGILMLADSIEAAARTLEDPSPQKLEVLIDDLIKKRFEEGELDECPLTLKDLTKIKKAFLGVLVGVYHARVKYPGSEAREETRPDDGDAERQKQERAREAKPAEGTAPSQTTDGEESNEQRLTRTIKTIDNQ
ncbi:MAG: HDIG domain-containing protein [Ignavibacteriae bacterium]|nr:HDIG domain-containing protein [Ignavibacteriota bacterium]